MPIDLDAIQRVMGAPSTYSLASPRCTSGGTAWGTYDDAAPLATDIVERFLSRIATAVETGGWLRMTVPFAELREAADTIATLRSELAEARGEIAGARAVIEAQMMEGAIPPNALPVGTATEKPEGYGFPGEVRSAYTTRAGLLRYVVEATGPGYEGMQHIFAPTQVRARAALAKEAE